MKKPKQSAKDSLKHLDMEFTSATSAMDCTGLIPAAPATEADLEAYQELYKIGVNVKDEAR